MHVRTLGVLGVLVALVLSAAAPARDSASTPSGTEVETSARIGVTVPKGWLLLHKRLTPCTDPIERLTVAGHGALVMLQERLHPAQGEFAPRPRHFELDGAPEYIECCAPLQRRGWITRFTDSGRGFYVYVYLGARGTRAEALAVLDSLRIERFGRSREI